MEADRVVELAHYGCVSQRDLDGACVVASCRQVHVGLRDCGVRAQAGVSCLDDVLLGDLVLAVTEEASGLRLEGRNLFSHLLAEYAYQLGVNQTGDLCGARRKAGLCGVDGDVGGRIFLVRVAVVLVVTGRVGLVRLHERDRPRVLAKLVQRGGVRERDDAGLDLIECQRNRCLFDAEDLPTKPELGLAVVAGAAIDVLVDSHVDLSTRLDGDVDVIAVGERTMVVGADDVTLDVLRGRWCLDGTFTDLHRTAVGDQVTLGVVRPLHRYLEGIGAGGRNRFASGDGAGVLDGLLDECRAGCPALRHDRRGLRWVAGIATDFPVDVGFAGVRVTSCLAGYDGNRRRCSRD